MKTVQEPAREIVAREGGYVNDPDDPGSETNFGVTIGTMRRLGLDLNRDGAVDSRDIRAMTADRAADIYIAHYFIQPRICDLPPQLQASVFDMYVNAGAGAVKILQRLLTQMGYPCSDDGSLAPPRAAPPRWPPQMPPAISPMLTALRGAIFTMPWVMRALPAANLPAGAMAARAVG